MALHTCLPRGYRIGCKAHVQCWGEKPLIFCSTPNLLMPFPKSVSRPGRFEEEVPLFDACDSKNPLWKQESYAKVKPSVKDCTLTVYGVLVDFIYYHHGPTLHMNKDDVDDLLSVGDQLPNYRPTGESFRSAYLRTMVADLKVQGQDVVGRGGSTDLQSGKGNTSPGQLYSRHLLQQISLGRMFFTTLQHDYMGLAPYWAAPGDAIFMLLGGEMLYIARPTLDGTYHYVGEAYVHGVMDGQVVQAFERGEGILQRVEFVPVIDPPSQKTQPKPSEFPVGFKAQPLGYNIESQHFSNPNENIIGYVHSDIGPQIDKVIGQIAPEVTASYVMQGLSPRDAFTKCMLLGEWAKVVENRLLQGSTGWKGKSKSFEPAGREFAKRLYVRSALALERGRHKVMWQGRVAAAMALQGGTHVIDADEGHHMARDYFMEAEDLHRTPLGQQMAEDEKLARGLQELEWYAPPPKTSDGPVSSSVLGDFGLRNESPPPRIGTRSAQKASRPERLMMPPTRNPHIRSYKFRNKEQMDAFIEDMKGYSDRGECPPVLSGRMVTDPSMRPKVEIITYGKPGDLRWEDEQGCEVMGPTFDEILGAGSDSDSESIAGGFGEMAARQPPSDFIHMAYPTSSWGDLVIRGEWEGLGEAEVPCDFEMFEETEDLNNLIANEDWEGPGEAEVPRDFKILETGLR